MAWGLEGLLEVVGVLCFGKRHGATAPACAEGGDLQRAHVCAETRARVARLVAL
jgi:hypothetical protein